MIGRLRPSRRNELGKRSAHCRFARIAQATSPGVRRLLLVRCTSEIRHGRHCCSGPIARVRSRVAIRGSCSRRICGGSERRRPERVVTGQDLGVRSVWSATAGRLCGAAELLSGAELTKGQSWLSRLEIASSSRRSRRTVLPAAVWWRRLCGTTPSRGIEFAGTMGTRASTRRPPER
jgi:hypothetical protein